MNEPATTFVFGFPIAAAGAVALLAVVALLSARFWWPRLRGVAPGRRLGITLLRTAALLLVLFMALDPIVVKRKTAPDQQYVVLLFDDSRSMRIAGEDGISRGQRLLRAYEAAQTDFEDKLRETHHVAMYRFGDSVSRLASVRGLDFGQNRSDLVGAVSSSVKDLAGAKIAAVVLFSDGVPQTGTASTAGGETLNAASGKSAGGASAAAAAAAAGSGVPIYTVGVDTQSKWRDLELKHLTVARTNFDKSPVTVTADISATGMNGRHAMVEVLEGEKVVATRPLSIGDDAMDTKVRLDFIPQTKGWDLCQARVRLSDPAPVNPDRGGAGTSEAPAERVTENNAESFIVDNRQKSYRVLYFSGRPNYENKFVARAVADDPEIKLSSLIRISGPERKFEFRPGAGRTTLNNVLFEGFDESEMVAPHFNESVFLRIGLSESELGSGYPMQASDLFPYDLVIWGDIEKEFFSPEHLQLTRDFVSKRGGSFLMVGGPRAFSEGHYNGTMIADMLPVMLESQTGETEGNMKQFFKVQPTVEGFLSGAWALDPDPERDQAMWEKLPELFGINRFPLLRAGSTELARSESDKPDVNGQTLFAWQHYGLGRTAVLATGETWPWKMESDPDDGTHGRIWRQLIRSLVSDVPQPVVLQKGAEALTAGETSQLQFLVRDANFDKREGLSTTIQMTAPGQKPRDLASEESIASPGVYTCDFTPETTGMHILSLTAQNEKSEVVGHLEEAVDVEPDLREFKNANFNPDYLKSMSEASHGAYYDLNHLADLEKRIEKTATVSETQEFYHLWRYPALFAMLAALWASEWFLRRKYGQP